MYYAALWVGWERCQGRRSFFGCFSGRASERHGNPCLHRRRIKRISRAVRIPFYRRPTPARRLSSHLEPLQRREELPESDRTLNESASSLENRDRGAERPELGQPDREAVGRLPPQTKSLATQFPDPNSGHRFSRN